MYASVYISPISNLFTFFFWLCVCFVHVFAVGGVGVEYFGRRFESKTTRDRLIDSKNILLSRRNFLYGSWH
jgi:hypothetical protein